MSETTVHAVELKQQLQTQVQDHLKDLKDNGAILEYYRAKYQHKVAPTEKGPGTSDNSHTTLCEHPRIWKLRSTSY